MDYEKAYKDALGWVRNVYPTLTGAAKEDAQHYFPELRESEDERVRKEIIAYIKGELAPGQELIKQWITYLEKQKINTEGDFGRGYDCGYEACLNSHGAEWFEKQKPTSFYMPYNPDDYEVVMEGNATSLKQKEQKPADKCEECNNVKGCVTCVDGDQWAHIEEQKPAEVKDSFDDEQFRRGDEAGIHDAKREQKHTEVNVKALLTADRLASAEMTGRLKERSEIIDNPEKYGLQKPTKWSNEDWAVLCDIAGYITGTGSSSGITNQERANFLYELPKRFNLQPKQEWSEEDRMETINVFRPLAGTSIESATKQAVNKFTNSGEKFLLAFNGVFILIDNTKSVQDIVNEYNRSLVGKKKEQGQSEEEPNDFEITLNDCMLAAQQYPPGKIGLDDVKMWAEELSNYCPKPNQKWSEFDWHCLERAIWYVENPAPTVVKDTNLVLWLKSLSPQSHWKPSEEQMTRLSECVIEARERHRASTSGYERYRILNSLYIDLRKLM